MEPDREGPVEQPPLLLHLRLSPGLPEVGRRSVVAACVEGMVVALALEPEGVEYLELAVLDRPAAGEEAGLFFIPGRRGTAARTTGVAVELHHTVTAGLIQRLPGVLVEWIRIMHKPPLTLMGPLEQQAEVAAGTVTRVAQRRRVVMDQTLLGAYSFLLL